MAMKISEIKSQLNKIQENIRALESFENSKGANNLSEPGLRELINETSNLLDETQNQPKHLILKQIAKRRAKRRRKKKTRERVITPSIYKNEGNIDNKEELSTVSNKAQQNESVLHKTNDKPSIAEIEFQQLRKYQQAQRYLRTFELLEILHYTRCEDQQLTQQLHEKFAHLRRFWNSILLENTPKRTEAKRIEDQWNEVLFGASEQTFYGSNSRKSERERVKDFLRIRRAWDSYLVRDGNQGSRIPIGWVLPPEEPSESWAKYRVNTESNE